MDETTMIDLLAGSYDSQAPESQRLNRRRAKTAERIFAIAAIALIVTISASATPKSRPSRIASRGPFKEVPVKFPSDFLGHSAVKIFAPLGAAKNEFESTDEYQSRRTDSIRPGIYVFVWRQFAPEYDADSQEFSFGLETERFLSGYEKTDRKAYVLGSVEEVPVHSYVAENSFGKKVRVLVSASRDYVFVRRDDAEPVEKVSVVAPRNDAARLKNQLRAAIAVRLASDSFPAPTNASISGATGFIHADPTINSPFDISSFQEEVVGDVAAILIVNIHTGRVVARFNGDGQFETGELKPLKPPATDDVVVVDDPSTAPIVVSKVDAENPEAARRANVTAAATVSAVVGIDGMPRDVQIVTSALFGVDIAAAVALAGWRFKPATLDGVAVATRITVTFNFAPNMATVEGNVSER